jgi:hypothetical protein
MGLETSFPPNLGGLSNFSIGNTSGFPDPFTDAASLAMPESMVHILRWCEFIVSSNGAYRTALERVLSYFVTDIEVSDCGDQEKEKYEKFLIENLGIYQWLHDIGFDYLTYGNSFVSLLMPFKRYLTCPKCFIEFPLHVVHDTPIFGFQWNDFNFNAKCPKCNYSGVWKHKDRRASAEGIVLRRWSPHEMEVLHDHYTGQCEYIWKIPSDYKKQIVEGTLYQLERANWEVIQAIKHDQYLRFAKDTVFHLKEHNLSGIRDRGWGISRVLSNFRQAWYVQVLHRYNEAIALDYIIPFRVITPAPGPGGGNPEAKDPVFNFGLGGFVGRINQMLRRRRRDPAAWNVIPFPVQYQALGGDAKALAPKDLLDQGIELLLNNVGVPVELFKGSLQVQTAPAALRLFESHWNHLVHNLNRFLRFVAKRLSDLLSWDKAGIKLVRVTTADDLNRQQAKLQLMTGSELSRTTGLKSIGIDWKEEVKRRMQEQKYQAEQEKLMQDEMSNQEQQQQMATPQPPGGAPAGPGGAPADPNAAAQGGGGQPAPAPGGGQQVPMGGGASMQSPVAQAMAQMPVGDNVPITPQELMSRASTLAQQILQLPEAQKDSELIQLKKVNSTLHSLVKAQIDAMRQQARTAGGAQLMAAQGFGGGGGPPPQGA